jgi:glycine/D-amino acid oxidase-like deaminating enzyme
LKDEQLIRDFAEKYVPLATGATMKLDSCMFTLTPDHNFIIDNHPLHKQVLLAAGFSGHGFKFASVIGELLAEKMEQKKSNFDLKMFELKRFVQ